MSIPNNNNYTGYYTNTNYYQSSENINNIQNNNNVNSMNPSNNAHKITSNFGNHNNNKNNNININNLPYPTQQNNIQTTYLQNNLKQINHQRINEQNQRFINTQPIFQIDKNFGRTKSPQIIQRKTLSFFPEKNGNYIPQNQLIYFIFNCFP